MVVVQDGIHEEIGSGLRCDAVMMQFRRLSEISCNPYWLRLDATGSMTRSRLTITRTGNPARSVNVGCRSKLRRVTRPEKRRVGKEGVIRCRYCVSPYH